LTKQQDVYYCSKSYELGEIISFTGTHGVGKTTSVYELAYQYKLKYPDKTVYTLNEVARNSPYLLNKKSCEQGQLWIFNEQIKQELELITYYDYIITDRTAVDSIAYSSVYGFNDLCKSMFNMLGFHVGNYNKIYFKIIENNDFAVNDGVREADDLEFRQNVENELKKLYNKLIEMNYLKEDTIEYI